MRERVLITQNSQHQVVPQCQSLTAASSLPQPVFKCPHTCVLHVKHVGASYALPSPLLSLLSPLSPSRYSYFNFVSMGACVCVCDFIQKSQEPEMRENSCLSEIAITCLT